MGVATLPFEGEGRSVLLRSGLHFLVTAGSSGPYCGCALVWRGDTSPVAGSAGGHLPGGLAGQVGGVVRRGAAAPLRPGAGSRPIPLRWRESLPYLPVLLLVNAVLPAVLALLDAPDVPVLRALLIPCLLLPLGGFFPALSLGKRQGVCLLYPAASLLIFLPASLWVYGGQRIPLFWGIALACPLAGNLVGAAWRRRKERRRPQWNGCC